MPDVATLSLVIEGKSDTDKMLQSVSAAAQSLSAALSGLTPAASASGAAVDSAGANAAAGAAGLGTLAQSAADAQNGLAGVTGAAESASGASADAGGSAESGGAGFNTLGAGTQVATAGLNAASEAANGFGLSLGPATAVGNEFTHVVGSMGDGLGELALAGGVAVVAISGIIAALAGEALNAVVEFGAEVRDLVDLTGSTPEKVAPFIFALQSIGLEANDAGRALNYVQRQIESENQAMQDAADQGAAKQVKAGADIADSQAALARAYQDTQAAIQQATDNEATNLETLASKHAETVEKIKESIQTLTDDYNQAESDRLDNLKTSMSDRKTNEQDSLNTQAGNHDQALARIAQSQHRADEAMANAHTAAARASARDAQAAAALQLRQENENYAQSVKAIQTRDARADAADKAKYAKEEERAKTAFEKKQAQLAKELADEDKKYAAAVTKEEKQYAEQLGRLNKHYADEEAAAGRHIAKMNEAEAGGGTAAPKESPFAKAIMEVLTASEGAKAAKEDYDKLLAGQLNIVDLQPKLFDGFQKIDEEAKAHGQSANLAADADAIWGARIGYKLLPAALQGAAGLEKYNAEMRAAGIDPAKAVEATAKWEEAMTSLNISVLGVKQAIAEELIPQVIEWLNQLHNWINTHRAQIVGFFEDFGNAAKSVARFLYENRDALLTLATVAGAFLAVMLAMKIAIIAVEAATIAYKTALIVATAIQWAFNIALDANPIGAVILALVALAAGVYLAYQNWDKITAAAQAVWDWFTNSRWGAIIVELAFGPIVLGILEVVKHWDDIRDGAQKAWDGINGIKWEQLGKNIMINLIKGISGYSLASAILGDIPGASKVGGAISDTLGGAKKLIPHLAAGGIVTRPTLAVIGDRGPEAVVPLGGRGGTAFGDTNVNFNGPIIVNGTRSQLPTVAFAAASELRSRFAIAML